MAQTNLIHNLRAQWRDLMRCLSVDDVVSDRLFAELVSHYSDDGRHYHTLEHVYNILDSVERLGHLARDKEAILLAAWYHDAVYDMEASDNELRSAVVAGEALAEMGLAEGRIKAIKAMIRFTDISHTPPDDIDCKILIDSDLAKLASSEDEYFRNSEAIRLEFAFVPEEDYLRARRDILVQFLARKRIFQTEFMYAACEEKARRNIALEIEELSQRMEAATGLESG